MNTYEEIKKTELKPESECNFSAHGIENYGFTVAGDLWLTYWSSII